MLIVCTQDKEIRRADVQTKSWGTVTVLPAGGQEKASEVFKRTLMTLRNGEPLCISAHGNDSEIGDSSPEMWRWSYQAVALMLSEPIKKNAIPSAIFISACGRSVANFSTQLVVELGKLLYTDDSALPNVWVYGYNNDISSAQQIPSPDQLDELLRTDFGLQVTNIGRPSRR